MQCKNTMNTYTISLTQSVDPKFQIFFWVMGTSPAIRPLQDTNYVTIPQPLGDLQFAVGSEPTLPRYILLKSFEHIRGEESPWIRKT